MGKLAASRRGSIHFRNAIAPQDTNKRKQLRRTNERTNERRERFLSNKMTTIKRGFWCLCVSALLAGAMCQEGARRKVLDMHEAVVENATDAMMNATMNATDAMMNGTMNGTDAMNGTEEEHDHDHDHEGEDHEGEESTDDAGTDGDEESEDDSRRKLLDMHDAVMEEATDAMMNATMNVTDPRLNGTLNATVGNATEEEHDHDHDHEGEDHEGEDHEGEESSDDAGTDGGEESEDDSRRKLLDMHEAMMEEATDAMMNATMNATD